MITEIRSKLQSKHSRIAVSAFVALVIIGLVFPGTFMRMGKGGMWVATVNGTTITTNDIAQKQQEQRVMINTIKSMYPQYADIFLRMYGLDGDSQLQAVETLINEALLNQYADSLGVVLHGNYIMDNAAIVAPPTVRDSRGINAHAVAQYAQEVGITGAEFDENIQHSLKRKFATDVATIPSYVPVFELKQRYVAKNLKKKFSVVSFSLDAFAKREQAKPVTDELLAAFYAQQNKATQRYWVNEKRSGSVWTFDRAKYGVTVPDKAIETYYERHKVEKFQDAPVQLQVRTITLTVPSTEKEQEVLKAAQELADQVKKDPTTFEAVAKKQSQDSAKGSVSSWFAKGKHEPAFDAKAFTLQNDGDIADPVKTKDGWVIIQRVGRKAATYKPLSSVKKEIIAQLEPRFFAEQFAQDARAITQKNDEQAAKALVSKHSGAHKTLTGVEVGSSPEAALLGKIKEVGGFAYQTMGDKGVLVKLDQVIERNLPTLESIKETVRADYIAEKAKTALKDHAKEIAAFAPGKKIDEIQEKFKGKLETTDWVNPTDKDSVDSLRKKGFPIDEALALEKVGSVITHQAKDTAYVVILEKLEPFDQTAFEKQKKALALEADRDANALEQGGLVASLRRTAILDLNDSVISRQKDGDHARKNNQR